MRHFISTLTVLVCLGSLLTACAGTATPAVTPDINSPLTRIRIGVTTDIAPYVTYDSQKKEVSGFDVDLMKAIAAKADIYVEFVTVNAGYNQLISQVGQCQLDGGISAIPISDYLATTMDFSEPYLSTGQALVVKKGNIKINGVDDLGGMTVGAHKNSLSALELEKMQGPQTKLYESVHLAFQDLIPGYLDAVVADLPHAWIYVKAKPNNLKIVGDQFGSVSLGIAFCKDKADVLEKINSALAGMKQDGSLDKLVREWQLNNYGE